MSKRTWTISSQRDEGFMLNVEEKGARRFWWPVSDGIHAMTRNRFFYTDWAQRFMNWIEEDSTEVTRIPIAWEHVSKISPGTFDWSINAPTTNAKEQ